MKTLTKKMNALGALGDATDRAGASWLSVLLLLLTVVSLACMIVSAALGDIPGVAITLVGAWSLLGLRNRALKSPRTEG